MGKVTDTLQDRIHSSAKGHVLERSQTSAPPSATTPNPPTHNVLPGPAPKSTASRSNDLEKQLDGTADPSPSGSSNDNPTDVPLPKLPPPAPPPGDTKETGEESTALALAPKPSLASRAKAGSSRFIKHTKDAIFHSWVNVLLIFVPIGIAVRYAPLPRSSQPTIIFAMNAVAIIPLAGLLSHATESVASRMGDTLASLLNVTFGNAVELIIFIIALAKNEIRIVQASILGSILANLLLILGMAFAVGGLRYQEQVYNNTVTQMSACLLSLSVTSLLLPTAFHASFSNLVDADDKTLKISRGTSVVLLLVYALYLLFQLKSHAYMYESTPQEVIDEESHPGVLADMINRESSETSTSSSSSSSSSSDSESSSGTGSRTNVRRFKRAFRHKKRAKSSASSTQATSLPSTVSSPSTEMPPEGYFDAPDGRRHESHIGSIYSEGEADIDEKHERGMPRVRDFETEQGDANASPDKSMKRKFRKHARKYKKSKSKAKKPQQLIEADDPAPEPSKPPAVLNQVEFVEEPQEIPPHSSARRPFPLRQISRPIFRPPLPSVLTNTVFSNPPPAPPGRGQQAGLALARGTSSTIRRTNSLPDRLNRQQYIANPAAEAIQPSGSAAPNNENAVAKDAVTEDGRPQMSRTAAVMLLLVSTGLVAFCAELLVDAIPNMVDDTSVSQIFIGLIVLPIVGNAAEHVTAVTVAAKNKMDLAIGVAVGSSIQIALFITPVVVLIGWIMNKDMSLYFDLFETVSLFVTAFVVNFLVLDGRSNYLEGSLLMSAYVIIAVCAFFYPNTAQQSALGGGRSY